MGRPGGLSVRTRSYRGYYFPISDQYATYGRQRGRCFDVLLDGLADRLADEGVDPARIKTRTDRDVKPVDAIADLAEAYDCVVMGESDPTLSTFVFGMPADQVADRFLGPVLVVQRESAGE